MNRTQKWQKIAENRLVIMGDMEKQNDALEQQNADLVAALTDILGSKTEQVFDSDGKTLKGYTLYVPKERLWKAFDVSEQALAQAKEE